MHFKRVLIEHIGQALTIGTGLLDRLLLTAVLLRVWGAVDFATWSLCIAAAGMVSLFDFGFSLYFNNRLMEETEQNRPAAAQRTLAIANTVFGFAGVLGLVTIAAIVVFLPNPATGSTPDARMAVLVLAAGTSLRIVAAGFHALYRAHREYAKLAFFQASADVARIFAAILVCLTGGHVLAVAVSATVFAVSVQTVYPVVYAIRRFGTGGVSFALIPRRELGPIFRTSGAFFAQLVPIILLTSLPVLYLGQLGVPGTVLTAFVLMRTLSGAPRALLQQFGVVLGQECSRRLAVSDHKGAAAVVAEGARFYAVSSGVAMGLLLGAGSEISELWTGSDHYFRVDYILAAVAPMALAAFAVLAHNILVTTNAPFFGTVARWTQLAVTAVCAVFLPVADIGLAVLLALSMGEILGFVPLAYCGVARLVRGITFWFYARESLTSLGAAAIAAIVTQGVLWLADGSSFATRTWAVILAVTLNAGLVPWLGVSLRTRRTIVEQFVLPRLATLAASFRG